jgi:hypothetical protein
MDTLMKLKPGEMPPEDIIQKAADFAKQRQAAGKSFFAQPGEEASVKLPTATPPKKGEVRKGYRYIGGPNEDEGDPKNWEKT